MTVKKPTVNNGLLGYRLCNDKTIKIDHNQLVNFFRLLLAENSLKIEDLELVSKAHFV